jgi:chromate reductase
MAAVAPQSLDYSCVCYMPQCSTNPYQNLFCLQNHFGSSVFSFKPSAIVTYSAGQWGGTRAAHSLRPILSELGCLPVSAMIHLPKAQDILDENGEIRHKVSSSGDSGEENRKQWESYTSRTWNQLEWWGAAAKDHRNVVNPLSAGVSPALAHSPSQRNAPQ